MINLDEVTKFDRTTAELEEFAIFSVLVAGKTAKTMVASLDRFLNQTRVEGKNYTPFEQVRYYNWEYLANQFKSCGIGCYNQKAGTVLDWAEALMNLSTCTIDDLEKIKGVAEKTSRFFILHTRPNQQIAALDRHILSYLRDNDVADVPTNTPKGRTYKRLEKEFLSLCQQQGKTPAELDLEVWYKYSKYKA
jgi:thermostable 8-oxoguanine DNA glycosylase